MLYMNLQTAKARKIKSIIYWNKINIFLLVFYTTKANPAEGWYHALRALIITRNLTKSSMHF